MEIIPKNENAPITTDKPTNAASSPSSQAITFAIGDPENPYNWSQVKKCLVVVVSLLSLWNGVFDVALPSGASSFIEKEWHVENKTQSVLPISVYLLGWVLGPLLWGPLSEAYGRRLLMIGPFVLFTLFTLACAVSRNWPSFLVFRFFCGTGTSSALAVLPGIFADIYDNPISRGRAMALFMSVTNIAPTIAPIVSGFVSPLEWRWTFWIGLIVAGVTLVLLLFLPETYGPVLLKQRAQKLRRESGNPEIFAPCELEKKSIYDIFRVTLSRPFQMVIFEPIVTFTCLYLSLVIALYYLLFQGYPRIFREIYGMSIGMAGLAYLPVIPGTILGILISFLWDGHLRRAQQAQKPWSFLEEYRRLPLACFGGPLLVISIFWLGWTGNTNKIHWIVPMLSGIPFGTGVTLIFLALLNYLTDAYTVYSASAMAAASCCRSIGGALLPMAAPKMYESLGIGWGESLLAFLSLGMCAIPIVFVRFGASLRERSPFCVHLSKERSERTL